jgi:hypothetical protein
MCSVGLWCCAVLCWVIVDGRIRVNLGSLFFLLGNGVVVEHAFGARAFMDSLAYK